jgi:cytochrome c-type biogenesis protein CcmH/NrfG
LKLAMQALELKPDHPTLWLCAGSCQRELGLVGAAQHSIQQALQLNPRSPEARLALEQLAHAGFGTRVAGWWKRCFGR